MRKPAEVDEEQTLIERALRLTLGFAPWSAHRMAPLLSASVLRRYTRDTLVLDEEGGPAQTIALVSGHVLAQRVKADGSRSALGLIGPGRLIGMTRALEVHGDACFSYTAHSDVTVVHLPSEQLLELLDAEPALWKAMVRMVLRHQRELLGSLLDQMIGGVHERVAATIDRLATLHGAYGAQGRAGESISLRLRLSQEDLAGMLQVSRQTVNKALRALQDSGVIAPDYNSVTIVDRLALRKAAGKLGPAP